MVQKDRSGSKEFRKKVLKWSVVGGLAFWAANFFTSLTPLAGEYRAALSISYFPMLVQALVGGAIISCCLSYILLRFSDQIPVKSPMLKSLLLSLVAFIIALIFVVVAADRTSDVSNVFLVGAVINIPRFLAVGLVIGYLFRAEMDRHGPLNERG